MIVLFPCFYLLNDYYYFFTRHPSCQMRATKNTQQITD